MRPIARVLLALLLGGVGCYGQESGQGSGESVEPPAAASTPESPSLAPPAAPAGAALAAFERGDRALRAERHTEAGEHFSEAIRLRPDFAAAYAGRGSAREKLGDWQGTVEDWRRALKLEPNATWAAQTRQNLKFAAALLAEQQGGRN